MVSTNPSWRGVATVDMATVLGRYVAGENYFWIFDKAPGEAARIVSLLWAASLRAATETGRIVRTALRMKLAELSANSSDPLLQQLHASLSSSVFTDGPRCIPRRLHRKAWPR